MPSTGETGVAVIADVTGIIDCGVGACTVLAMLAGVIGITDCVVWDCMGAAIVCVIGGGTGLAGAAQTVGRIMGVTGETDFLLARAVRGFNEVGVRVRGLIF